MSEIQPFSHDCSVQNEPWGNFICIFQNTYKLYQENHLGFINPVELFNYLKMVSYGIPIKEYKQEDAYEFFQFIIDTLEKNFISNNVISKIDWLKDRQILKTPIANIFGGLELTT